MLAKLSAFIAICAVSAELCAAPANPLPVIRVGRLLQSPRNEADVNLRSLATFLESSVPGYAFEYIPYEEPNDLMAAVANGYLSFAQVNPVLLVQLEAKYGVTPLATTVFLPHPGLELQTLGGVLFCRADTSIRSFTDLRGKRLALTHQHSMAALAVLRELHSVGIQPEKDLAGVEYFNLQKRVLDAVRKGQAECGVAPSNTFETLKNAGALEGLLINVLPPPRKYQGIRDYPVAVSTQLYPASAFVKTRQTPLSLANKVARALLNAEPGSELAHHLGVGGWSVPLNYAPVHECLQELGISPYEQFGQVTLSQAIRQHWIKFLAGMALITVVLAFVAIRASRLNGQLRISQSNLRAELAQRQVAEDTRIKLEAQLRQSQKMESIGRLAGGVAHDFNNLLTVINGYSDLLLNGVGDRELQRESLRQIAYAGERAAKLTQQLLAFSRKQTIQPKALNLNDAVRESAKFLGRVMGEDVEIATVLDPSLAVTMADPVQIDQVLLNLAVNARDAMPNGGKFTIETANAIVGPNDADGDSGVAPGAYVLMTVTDTGTGMTEEVRRNLFEPFFTTKGQGKGTGLGLSTVYGIVRQSEGYIFATTEMGRGSAFKIYLPSAGSASPVETPAGGSGGDTRGAETVLVVEDQEEVRELAQKVLELHGYRVLAAASATEAIGLIERRPQMSIHLLLTDVVMPGMTGQDLASRVKSTHPGAKVLYMSGYMDNVITHDGAPGSGILYIAKPFTPQSLAAKIREALG